MRSTIFKLIAVLSLTSSVGYSQTISYSGKNVQLKEIFEVIKNQTGIVFFYDATLLKEAKPITVEWKNVSIVTAFNEMFHDQPLTWVFENQTVTIIKKPAPTSRSPQKDLIRVKGLITDEEGIPIHGVSVIIKGSNRGTFSDNSGNYVIEVERKAVLQFSSINFSKTERVVDKSEINIQLEHYIQPMEIFLVGGNLNSIKKKADATAVTVLDAKTLEKIPVNTLDQIFTGWVPGSQSVDVGDTREGLPTLTIRGAGGDRSLTIIAVYIDGIEYAGGSGYLSQLDKNNIDRIEIVRGPGAATLYGAGSNGGIIQIFTKKLKPGEVSLNLTTSAGFYKSKWVKNDPFQQMHNLESTTTFNKITLRLGGAYRTVNAYLPDGGETNKSFYATAGFKSRKLVATITSNYRDRHSNISRRPYYDTALHPRTDIIIEPSPGMQTPAYIWFSVKPTPSTFKQGVTTTFISAINLSHSTSKKWLNQLYAGFTANTYDELPVTDGINPLQRQFNYEKNNITTVRYTNILNLHTSNHKFSATISSGIEYKQLASFKSLSGSTAGLTSLSFDSPANENFGAFVHATPSYKNLYLTLALRYEKNSLFKAVINPRFGLTTNFQTAAMVVKPKISWGRGITSPTYVHRYGNTPTSTSIIYPNPDIKPQSQQGFDYGIEIYHKKAVYKFEIVYYDNIIKDMIGTHNLGPLPGNPNVTASIYTNACKVSNKGWEFYADYQIKRFNLRGTFSIMNTKVEDTTGSNILSILKVAPGSRLLNLPKHTAGLNITYNFHKLFGNNDKGAISVNVIEVDGVISLDRINYRLDVAYGRTPFVPGLLAYTVVNPVVFRVGLYGEYYVIKELRFFLQGNNILNDYDYAYSNSYTTQGAAWLFGLKYNFISGKD